METLKARLFWSIKYVLIAVFKGDASTTRSDYFLGDNIRFNKTLFDQAGG